MVAVDCIGLPELEVVFNRRGVFENSFFYRNRGSLFIMGVQLLILSFEKSRVFNSL